VNSLGDASACHPKKVIINCFFPYSLAWAEMYIVIAALVQHFDFKLVGAGPKNFECVSDQFIVGTADTTGIKAIFKKYAAWELSHCVKGPLKLPR
jgi:hypothetical protein